MARIMMTGNHRAIRKFGEGTEKVSTPRIKEIEFFRQGKNPGNEALFIKNF